MLNLAVIISLACLLLTLIAGFALHLSQRSVLHRAEARVEKLRKSLEQFQTRLRMIESHAIDYINSLGPEATHALYEIRQILNAQLELLNELQMLINQRNFDALQEAERVLQSEENHTTNQNALSSIASLPSVDPEADFEGRKDFDQILIPKHWELKIEHLIQIVGTAVALASQHAEFSGIPKRRKRKPTSTSLKEAGIFVREHFKEQDK